MSDEQLVAIVYNRAWTSGEEGLAAAELHRRQKLKDDKNIRIQKWLLYFTIAILFFTIIGIFVTWFVQQKNNTDSNTTGYQTNQNP